MAETIIRNTTPPERAPLTEEECGLLYRIYYTRRNLLFSVFGIMIGYVLYRLWAEPALHSVHLDQKHKRLDFTLSPSEETILLTVIFLLPIIGYAVRLYFRSIHPYLVDARNGEKETISYRIVRKLHFPYTDQYFISLDDPRYMHHEVDAQFYQECHEGDQVFLYRGPKSRYVFNKSGRFTLM